MIDINSLIKPISIFKRSRLGRDLVLFLGAQAYYRLASIVILVVLSRRVSEMDIGIFFFALSIAEMLSVIITLSVDPVTVRQIAAEQEKAGIHFSDLLGIRLVSGPLYLLCLGSIALFIGGRVGFVVFITALFTLFDHYYFTFGSLFIALRKIIYNVSIGVSVQTLFIAVFLWAMFVLPSLNTLLAVYLFRSVCLVTAALFVTTICIGRPSISLNLSLLRKGFPFLLLTLLTILQFQLDTLLLKLFTDYETVGHYNLASRIIFASFFIPGSLGSVFYQRLAADRLTSSNRRSLVQITTILIVIGFLMMTAVYILAEPLTHLMYGQISESISPLLRPLSLLFPLNFTGLFLVYVLQALHKEKETLNALIISTLAGLILNLVLLPLIGVYGAVISRISAALLHTGFTLWLVKRLLH
ncbi:MAG: oligosaccharide flippase family protein [Candidatus Aminicenantes bacterium]|nr:MAG: oligosaccharide flippase family protein [Candidatus Aminicenantes bacterium]